jgi:hypothetical protein
MQSKPLFVIWSRNWEMHNEKQLSGQELVLALLV